MINKIKKRERERDFSMISPMTKVFNEINKKAYRLLDWINVIKGVSKLRMLKKEEDIKRIKEEPFFIVKERKA